MSLGKTSLTKTVYTYYISNIYTSTVDANLNRNINGIANFTILGGILFIIETHNLITVLNSTYISIIDVILVKKYFEYLMINDLMKIDKYNYRR